MAARIFTRSQFHDLIWSKPLRTVAREVGVSDVAVRKVALRAGLPLPPQGHWNRVAVGKRSGAEAGAAPARGFGATDTVYVGAGVPSSPRASVDDPPPEPPVFDEPMEDVRKRAASAIGKVAVPRDFDDRVPKRGVAEGWSTTISG